VPDLVVVITGMIYLVAYLFPVSYSNCTEWSEWLSGWYLWSPCWSDLSCWTGHMVNSMTLRYFHATLAFSQQLEVCTELMNIVILGPW